MKLVVDASVAAKWFLPEADADKAQTLLKGRHSLHAPELLWVEVASVVWKCARKRFLSREEAQQIIGHATGFPVERHPVEPLLQDALTLALEHDRTVYDCLYLALAVRDSATLITEDGRLTRSLAGTRLARRVTLLADMT